MNIYHQTSSYSLTIIVQRLAQWQSEIEDPSTSAFKKKHLQGAVRMHEGWIESKKLRIKKVDEELWSIAAVIERMGKKYYYVSGGSTTQALHG